MNWFVRLAKRVFPRSATKNTTTSTDPAPVAPTAPKAAGASAPVDLEPNLLKSFESAGDRIPKLACSVDPVELPVKGKVVRFDFDYRNRLLVAQYSDNEFGDVSAWRFDTWEPTTVDWGLNATMMIQHQLAKALGANLETSVKIVESRSNDVPQGRFLNAQINTPSRSLLDFNQTYVCQVWDDERRQFIGGVVAQGLFGLPTFGTGSRHLTLTNMERNISRLRIVPFDQLPQSSLLEAAFSIETRGSQRLEFAPDDQYVVTHFGPHYKNGVQDLPFSASVYALNSTVPVWQRTYQRLPGLSESEPWAVLSAWLTDRHELIGIIEAGAPESKRYQLYDLVAGKQIGKAVSKDTKVHTTWALARRGIIVNVCDPDVLEVCQLGRPDSTLLRVCIPGWMSSQVTYHVCPEANYLVLFDNNKSVVRIHTLQQT